VVPCLEDQHQIWCNELSPVDLETPAEEGTKMGTMVGFLDGVCCVQSEYRICRGISTTQKTKCEGLSLPYLAAGSNVKNVWDLHRNKKILP
jgi:hypothetical protein